jgi:hypothetical protein
MSDRIFSAKISIEGDGTVWTLGTAIDAEQIAESHAPLVLTVTDPLNGTLVLSKAASVTLFPASGAPANPLGWIPGDAGLPYPCLYLPSVSMPDGHPVLYSLSDATLARLEGRIRNAMTAGTKIAIPFGGGDGGDAADVGEVVLNGALLPFAVIGRSRG